MAWRAMIAITKNKKIPAHVVVKIAMAQTANQKGPMPFTQTVRVATKTAVPVRWSVRHAMSCSRH
jgi:hypothetical protein